MIKIGYIRKEHGIKGELKIETTNSVFRKNFNKPLYIETNPLTEVHINTVKDANDVKIVSFKEFNDINQVLKFKGLNILANKEDLDPLEEDEYYIDDLMGLDVYNEEGKLLGKVTEVFSLPQCFYIRVDTHLVPFIDEFIISVTEDKIIIKEMEGLFDEN